MHETCWQRLIGISLLCGLCVSIAQPYQFAHAQSDDVAVPEYSGRDPEEPPILAPCSRFEEAYEDLGYLDKPLEKWADIYHESVSKVISESLEKPEIQCTGSDYESLLRPGPELRRLAEKLPPWKDTDVPVTRFDLARVLLENLRIYECALIEYDEFLLYDTTVEKFDEEKERQEDEDGRAKDDSSVILFFEFFFSDLMSAASKRSETIKQERVIARKALNRTLTLIGTMDRLRPLEAELECMQRMSIDIRNIAALSAETSACMPRTWYAKDALRDFKEDEEE